MYTPDNLNSVAHEMTKGSSSLLINSGMCLLLCFIVTPWLYLTYRSIQCVVSEVSHFLIRSAELQTHHTECTDLE